MMTCRLLVLLLLSLPAFAQQRNELAVSFGRSEFDALGDAPAFHLRGRRISPFAGLGLAFAVASIDRADVTYLQFDADLDDRFATALDPTTVLVSAKFKY
jgi:hypothetical protein